MSCKLNGAHLDVPKFAFVASFPFYKLKKIIMYWLFGDLLILGRVDWLAVLDAVGEARFISAQSGASFAF